MTQSSLKLKLSPVSTKFGGIFQDVFLACGLKTWAFGIPQAKMQYLLTLGPFLWRPAGQLLAIFIQGVWSPLPPGAPSPGSTARQGARGDPASWGAHAELSNMGGGQCRWAPESLGLSGGFSFLPGCYLTWFTLSQGSAFLSPAFRSCFSSVETRDIRSPGWLESYLKIE